jgi:hypothetical protein
MSRSHTNQARLHLRTNPSRIRGISRAIERTYVPRAKFPFVGLGLADYRQARWRVSPTLLRHRRNEVIDESIPTREVMTRDGSIRPSSSF